ncbi:hypothetical protein CR513_36167, partial [Mucuna pruriens]
MCDASNSTLGVVLGQRAKVGQPVHNKKGAENFVADHLSKIEKESEPMPIRDEFPDEQLLHIKASTPWFADICNYVATSQFPPEASRIYKEKLQ